SARSAPVGCLLLLLHGRGSQIRPFLGRLRVIVSEPDLSGMRVTHIHDIVVRASADRDLIARHRGGRGHERRAPPRLSRRGPPKKKNKAHRAEGQKPPDGDGTPCTHAISLPKVWKMASRKDCHPPAALKNLSSTPLCAS